MNGVFPAMIKTKMRQQKMIAVQPTRRVCRYCMYSRPILHTISCYYIYSLACRNFQRLQIVEISDQAPIGHSERKNNPPASIQGPPEVISSSCTK